MPDHGTRPNPWFGLAAATAAALLAAPAGCQTVALAAGAPLAERFLAQPPLPAPPPPPAHGAAERQAARPAAPVDPVVPLRQAEELVRAAEAHFQKGRGFYHSGDLEAARREFDLAVERLMAGMECPEARAAAERRLDQMVEAIHHYDVEGLGAGEDPDQPVFDKSPLDEILEMTFPVDPKLKDKIKEELAATVSQLPLEVNDAVVSYVNYFSSERGRRIMAAGLRRAARYRAMITQVLSSEGVPLELMQLAQAESGFMPRAVSRAKATGMWQFMASRGAQYGLVRNSYYDDRLDPEKSTRAAARHLRDLYHEFGDWYLAMAAYNCGPLTVARAVERTGYADFWELRKRGVLPKETANYVPAILAMIIVVKNAKDYGLDGIEEDQRLDYDTVQIAAPTNIALVADAAGCSVAEIRELNPALLKSLAPAGYAVRVPKDSGPRVVAGLNAVPPAKRVSWRLHRVAEGETPALIARRYSITPAALAAANPPDTLVEPQTGSLLAIPVAYREPGRASRAKGAAAHGKPARKAPNSLRAAAKRGSAHAQAARGRTLKPRRTAPAQVAAARRTRRNAVN